MYLFCYSCFAVLCTFIFVYTSVELLPLGESPIAVSGGGGGDGDGDDDDDDDDDNLRSSGMLCGVRLSRLWTIRKNTQIPSWKVIKNSSWTSWVFETKPMSRSNRPQARRIREQRKPRKVRLVCISRNPKNLTVCCFSVRITNKTSPMRSPGFNRTNIKRFCPLSHTSSHSSVTRCQTQQPPVTQCRTSSFYYCAGVNVCTIQITSVNVLQPINLIILIIIYLFNLSSFTISEANYRLTLGYNGIASFFLFTITYRNQKTSTISHMDR